MVHLVYCDNAGKQGERVLDKILSGRKTMVVRGAAGRKSPTAGCLQERRCTLWRRGPD